MDFFSACQLHAGQNRYRRSFCGPLHEQGIVSCIMVTDTDNVQMPLATARLMMDRGYISSSAHGEKTCVDMKIATECLRHETVPKKKAKKKKTGMAGLLLFFYGAAAFFPYGDQVVYLSDGLESR